MGGHVIGDILKALGQIGDARFRAVLFMGIGLAIALLGGFSWLTITLLQWSIGPSVNIPWIGEITWLDNAAGIALIPVMFAMSVFLMIPVASAFTGLFLDRVVEAVEAKHYPHIPGAQSVPLGTALRDSLAFLGVMLGANLLALIAYLLLAPLAPLIFWTLNGALLGREYSQMVAMRRMSRVQAGQWRKANRGAIWMLGIAMAIPLTIPVLNLLVPVIGVAAFTHLYHRLAPGPNRL